MNDPLCDEVKRDPEAPSGYIVTSKDKLRVVRIVFDYDLQHKGRCDQDQDCDDVAKEGENEQFGQADSKISSDHDIYTICLTARARIDE